MDLESESFKISAVIALCVAVSVIMIESETHGDTGPERIGPGSIPACGYWAKMFNKCEKGEQ